METKPATQTPGKPRKVGDRLVVTRFVPGYPIGLVTDAEVVVREVSKATPAMLSKGEQHRYRVERDDGRPGAWWVDHDVLRARGES